MYPVDDLFAAYARTFQEHREAEMTLPEYLEACRQDPVVYSTVTERLLAAIRGSTMVHRMKGSWLGRIFMDRTPRVPDSNAGPAGPRSHRHVIRRALIASAFLYFGQSGPVAAGPAVALTLEVYGYRIDFAFSAPEPVAPQSSPSTPPEQSRPPETPAPQPRHRVPK